jgi:hypothetical protein
MTSLPKVYVRNRNPKKRTRGKNKQRELQLTSPLAAETNPAPATPLTLNPKLNPK